MYTPLSRPLPAIGGVFVAHCILPISRYFKYNLTILSVWIVREGSAHVADLCLFPRVCILSIPMKNSLPNYNIAPLDKTAV